VRWGQEHRQGDFLVALNGNVKIRDKTDAGK
jgi:hypothetical protein